MNEDDFFSAYLRRCEACGDWFQVPSVGPDRDKLPDHAHVKMGVNRRQIDPGGLRSRISALSRKLRLDNI